MGVLIEIIEGIILASIDHFFFGSFILSLLVSSYYPIVKYMFSKILNSEHLEYSSSRGLPSTNSEIIFWVVVSILAFSIATILNAYKVAGVSLELLVLTVLESVIFVFLIFTQRRWKEDDELKTKVHVLGTFWLISGVFFFFLYFAEVGNLIANENEAYIYFFAPIQIMYGLFLSIW